MGDTNYYFWSVSIENQCLGISEVAKYEFREFKMADTSGSG